MNEILEGNKLIDRFMGVKRVDSFYKEDKDFAWQHVIKYHNSWDWLWPVCEKIQEQTGAITLEAIFRKLQERYKKIICNRHQLWEAVIEYIKWYNQNKTS